MGCVSSVLTSDFSVSADCVSSVATSFSVSSVLTSVFSIPFDCVSSSLTTGWLSTASVDLVFSTFEFNHSLYSSSVISISFALNLIISFSNTFMQSLDGIDKVSFFFL